MNQDREERIRARAYALWEHKGRQEGSHEAHWQQAETELGAEEAGERQPVDDGAATPMASGSDHQPDGTAPSARPAASRKSAGAGGKGTADAPAKAPRKKS